MEYFEDIVRNHLAQMRLLVEGGLVMYEDILEDKDPLLFDLVGEASIPSAPTSAIASSN